MIPLARGKTFIIAEAGVNHNGDVKLARRMVDAAAAAGADAVKFQTFQAKKLVTPAAARAKYQSENTGVSDSQEKMLSELELPFNAYQELLDACEEKNVTFMSTPFDEGSADFLDKAGMLYFKIPSGEITNKFLLQHIARKEKPVFLSTGMSTLEEVGKAVSWIQDARAAGAPSGKPELILLHCVSSYPAALADVNLLALDTMRRAFGLPVGYSDHTAGVDVAVAAVALGAIVIEKHFTLDRNLPGPDHKASLEPEELKNMVDAIRRVETALGDGVKKPAPSEKDVMAVVRRSLVAARDLKEGDVVAEEDIVLKRPGTGLAPELKERVVGMRTKKNVAKDTVLQWEHLKTA